jgi:hypothetical protein
MFVQPTHCLLRSEFPDGLLRHLEAHIPVPTNMSENKTSLIKWGN